VEESSRGTDEKKSILTDGPGLGGVDRHAKKKTTRKGGEGIDGNGSTAWKKDLVTQIWGGGGGGFGPNEESRGENLLMIVCLILKPQFVKFDTKKTKAGWNGKKERKSQIKKFE